MRRALWLLPLTLWPSITFTSPARSQESPVEPKAGKKAAASKAAGKSADEPRGGDAVKIPWDGGELVGVPQIVKRLYRLKKSGQWGPDRLPKLCQDCLKKGLPKLTMYATWYEALIAGHAQDDPAAKRKLKEAIELGYLNVTEMQESEELARIREDAEVKGWIDGLKKKLADRMVSNFQKGCDANFKAAAGEKGKPLGAELKTLSGDLMISPGKPSVLVVARTHHSPLEQQIPDLKRIQEKAPVSLLFWEVDPGAPHKARDASAYAESLKRRFDFSAPAGIIGRKEYLELVSLVEAHFDGALRVKERSEDEEKEVFKEGLPFIIVLDAAGAPVDSKQGVQAAWQIDYLIAKLGELPAAEPVKVEPAKETPAPPPTETKPEEKPSTPPAPPPAEDKKPESPTPPPGDAPRADAPKPEAPGGGDAKPDSRKADEPKPESPPK